MIVGEPKWVSSLGNGGWFHYWCEYYTWGLCNLVVNSVCALGPLVASALGGKRLEGKVRYGKVKGTHVNAQEIATEHSWATAEILKGPYVPVLELAGIPCIYS